MKRDVIFYSRKAWKHSRISFKKLGLKQRGLLFVYVIMSFIGKLLFFTRPIFSVADENLAEKLNEQKPFSFWSIFDGTLKPEQYRALSLTYFITDLMLFVGLIAIVILPVMMWAFLVPAINNRFYLLGFYYGLTIFFVVLGILYVLFSLIYYVPIAFVSRRQTVYEPGLVLKTVNEGLRKQGKFNIFFINFLYLVLFVGAILLIVVQGSTAFFSFLVTILGYRGFNATFIFSIVFLVFSFLFFIYIIPFFYGHLLLTQHLILADTMQPSLINPQATLQNAMGSNQPVELDLDGPPHPLPVDEKITQPTESPTTETKSKAKQPKK